MCAEANDRDCFFSIGGNACKQVSMFIQFYFGQVQVLNSSAEAG